jgi:hypothetical protein
MTAQPWEGEPDSKRWHTQGFACRIQRVPELLHLCGYVALPTGHPWHGLTYSDDVTPLPECDDASAVRKSPMIDVLSESPGLRDESPDGMWRVAERGYR